MTLSLFTLISLLFPLIVLATDSDFDSDRSQTPLVSDALTEILARGAPILGFDNGCSEQSNTCDWMAKVPDDTLLVHMNLPGTHDTSTWNYSDATQASLEHYTGPLPNASIFRCQEQSILQSLNDGIRVFDLRIAYNPGNDTIGFYHSAALLAPQTRIEDVFFGLYSWLDNHPTEAVLVSINFEGGTGTPNDAKLQMHLYDIFDAPLAKRYWLQTNGTLGTLGEARAMLTLLQRFDYTLLPPQDGKRIGIHLDPKQWLDNHPPSFQINYNPAKNQIASIEDYYEMGTNDGTEENIIWKYNATSAHIDEATRNDLDQLYITFASAEHNAATPPVPPRTMALGNGTDTPGVNQMLLPFLQALKGKRVGIIMLDFYGAVPGLVEAVIGL